jgi:hypothetical protein
MEWISPPFLATFKVAKALSQSASKKQKDKKDFHNPINSITRKKEETNKSLAFMVFLGRN